jgi:putative acetyltransferase
MMVTVRPECDEDAPGIRRVNLEALSAAEADLVDRLRARGKLLVSLVAEGNRSVVGHIAFSRVTIDAAHCGGAGLGPMAVLPDLQRRGIGSLLARAGLDRCREMGFDYVVVLGHPLYYPRFGFVPASRHSIRCKWPVPDHAFMILELREGALSGVSGIASYPPEFDEL